MEWDQGPPNAIRDIFGQAPLNDYKARPQKFRLPWGPIYYRGRTDGSARVLVIGQDPAATENVTRRILSGDAGKRVQGYLTKLGITRSYVMVNSVLYSIFGQFDDAMESFMDLPAVRAWRNRLLDALTGPQTQAVLAFGRAARHAVEKWPGAASFMSQGRVFFLVHPTARPAAVVRTNWNASLNAIAAKVAPDSDGARNLTPYSGSSFKPADLARIPLFDFGFGAPAWLGDGDTATRLNGTSIPAVAQNNPTILWFASGPEG
jgi:uracil-DNA glycosylase